MMSFSYKRPNIIRGYAYFSPCLSRKMQNLSYCRNQHNYLVYIVCYTIHAMQARESLFYNIVYITEVTKRAKHHVTVHNITTENNAK